jgi:prepilin-type N-terminal cleavage/methylation domain-containing protein
MAGRNTKQNKGFTLNEMLIVVAILAVLAAVSIPLIVAVKKNLKFTELNDTAREIYISVQNQLVGEKATGQLSELQTLCKSNGLYLSSAPRDFYTVDETKKNQWQELCFFESSSEESQVYSYLVDKTSFEDDLLKGQFIVEFNPATGDVYSVFYAEGEISYTAVSGLDRTEKTRKANDPMLGYYGGKIDESSASELPKEFHVDGSLVNREELYLDFSCDNLLSLTSSQENLTITITVKDQDTGAAATKTLQGRKDFFIQDDEMNFRILLDSMQTGYHFQDIIKEFTAQKPNTYPTPGDNLDVTVKAEFRLHEGGEVYIENGNGLTLSANSLFESREKTSDTDSIGIGYVRHLNNLRSEYCDFSASKKVQITQVRDIDFQEDNYTWADGQYSISADSPLSVFTPIDNETLNEKTTFDGSASKLLNFSILGGNSGNTGLFAAPAGWTLQRVTLVDADVQGSGYVGALAGRMTDCTVDACGVYLSTADADKVPYVNKRAIGTKYANRMEERRAEHTVSGVSNYVGGLAGYVSGGTITNSFAAIDVTGRTYAGGLAAYAKGCTLSGDYSSGDVTTTGKYAGGFIGLGSSVSVSSCYSTSDVTASSNAGGFVGALNGGSYTDCVAYGKVADKDGKALSSSGGFTGDSYATFSDCSYLKQKGYNDYESYDAQKIGGISAKEYRTLAREDGQIPGDPYNANLYKLDNCVFPFNPVGTEKVHHGDWPLEYAIQVALVYYERYTDGDYGLYAITSMSTGDTAKDNGERWLLNTLSDTKTCMEDGYALMTIYQLTSFDYSLNDPKKTANVTISKTAGADKAVKLETEDALLFKKCTVDTKTGQIQSTSSTDKFTAKNLYLYQLPFALQDTGRDNTAAFYDTLVLQGAETKDGSSAQLLSGYTFYYNPHFAKNAINPDPQGGNVATRPADPVEVYVRSARQLNAMGRYTYYWNTGNRPIKGNFKFLQETDIDFSLYVKTYCGVKFDLMDTSKTNAYRNRPIGRSKVESGKGYNFQNVFDGQYHKIIDYCVEASDYRFVGLFGEISDATLQNIVMTASDPAHDSGYVKSSYKSLSEVSGTGALVGLVYRMSGGSVTTVKNCAVSGYSVSFEGSFSNGVGGLAGYNMGNIENCSAVSKSVRSVPGSSGKYSLVGGLVGCNMYNVTNCYAGGSIGVTGNHKNDGTASVAGISGLVYSIYNGASIDKGKLPANISNCYSYCTPVDSGSENITYFGAAATVTTRNMLHSTYDHCSEQTVKNCYYFTETIPTGLTLKDGIESSGLGYDKMKERASTLGNAFGQATAENSHPWNSQKGEYPFPAVVKKVNAQNSSEYIHYGNWPLQTLAGGLFVYYEQYENYYGYYYVDPDGETKSTLSDEPILSSGYGYLTAEEIKSADLTVEQKTYPVTQFTEATPVQANQTLANGTSVRLPEFNRLGKLDGEALAAITPSAEQMQTSLLPELEITVGSGGYNRQSNGELKPFNNYSYRLYVNAGFAAAISTNDKRLGILTPFQIRTENDIQEISALSEGLPEAQIALNVTHDVSVNKQNVGGVNLAQTYVFSGKKSEKETYRISGLQQALFDDCQGTVQSVTLAASRLDSDGGAVLAKRNEGVIENCAVTDWFAAGGMAAGFVYYNAGEIKNCAAAGSTNSESASLAGFVFENDYQGSISNCDVNAAMAGADVAGFAWKNSGTIENSTVTLTGDLSGASAAGFVKSCSGGKLLSCAVNLKNSAVKAASGSAAGFVLRSTDYSQLTGCSVSGASGILSDANAAGFAAEQDATARMESCSVSTASVSAKGSAAGFILDNAGTVSPAAVLDCTVISAEGSAAGFVTQNSGSVSGSVTGTAVTAAVNAAGFFETNNNEITNSSYSGPQTAAVSAQNHAAGFGYANNGSVSGCSESGAVTGASAGGFIYTNGGSVSDCSESGAVSGTTSAGGFVYTNGGSVSGCTANGSATGESVGGFVFDNGGSVSGCTASENATGAKEAGGFVYRNTGSIYDSSKRADTDTAAATAAGFAFRNESTIQNCANFGSVTGSISAAGFAWENGQSGTITRCAVQSGTVEGTELACGFVGTNIGSLTACYARRR